MPLVKFFEMQEQKIQFFANFSLTATVIEKQRLSNLLIRKWLTNKQTEKKPKTNGF